MALWFIRLGEKELEQQKEETTSKVFADDVRVWRDWREFFLADKKCLITIDYNITKDITNMSDKEIQEHIEEINSNSPLKKTDIMEYSKQVCNFKNGIKEGDYVITPFSYPEYTNGPIECFEVSNNYRIGKFINEMGTLESLFGGSFASQNDLTASLDNPFSANDIGYSSNLKRDLTIDECRNFPTRHVKWLTNKFPEQELNNEIISQANKSNGNGAVAELKFKGQLPLGLVEDHYGSIWL